MKADAAARFAKGERQPQAPAPAAPIMHRTYPCGCSASGPGAIPNYCPTHGSPTVVGADAPAPAAPDERPAVETTSPTIPGDKSLEARCTRACCAEDVAVRLPDKGCAAANVAASVARAAVPPRSPP